MRIALSAVHFRIVVTGEVTAKYSTAKSNKRSKYVNLSLKKNTRLHANFIVIKYTNCYGRVFTCLHNSSLGLNRHFF